MKKIIKCRKCGKKADKFGHYIKSCEGESIDYYHWDCFDPNYNNLINAICKDAHKK